MTVRIDGSLFSLRHPRHIPPRDAKWLRRSGPRAVALLQRDSLTEDEEHEIGGILAAAVRIVLDAPADVQTRLTSGQQMQILQAHFNLHRR